MTSENNTTKQAQAMTSDKKKRAQFDLSKMLEVQNKTRFTTTPDRPFFDVNWHLITWNKENVAHANGNNKPD